MKQLYTSYYAKSGNHPKAIAISLFSPSFFRRRWYLQLAPTHPIIKAHKSGKITDEEYELLYLDLLENERGLTPQKVVDDLPEGSILLCYESTGKFCHRHIVARWLEAGADVKVTELVDPQEPQLVDELFGFE